MASLQFPSVRQQLADLAGLLHAQARHHIAQVPKHVLSMQIEAEPEPAWISATENGFDHVCDGLRPVRCGVGWGDQVL